MERTEIEHTDQDKVLKNLMKFNQSILKKKDTLEGVVELSLFGTEDDTCLLLLLLLFLKRTYIQFLNFY